MLKRFISITISIFMLLALCLPGFAAETTEAVDGQGNLNTFELPLSEGTNSFMYTDVQYSFPDVDWSTLDRLYIPAGNYDVIRLGNLPVRSADRPLIITNKGGQVKVTGGNEWYGISLTGGSNWIFTGEYNAELKTGDANYIGHANGNYANSKGKYGFEVYRANSSGVQIGGSKPTGSDEINCATNFEFSFTEVSFSGFCGLMIKADWFADFIMDGAKIHDLYIHDVDAEGMYIGHTNGDPNANHKITNMEVYNNRIIRAGSEGLQFSNMGDGNRIYNNAVIMNAFFWKNAFNIWQDGCLQFSQRDGKSYIYDNIFIGGAGGTFSMSFYAATADTVEEGDGVYAENNYFGFGRNTAGYLHYNKTNEISQFVFENNILDNYAYEYTEIDHPYNKTNPGHLWGVAANKANPVFFNNNVICGEQIFIDTIEGENGEKDNISASGNSKVDSVEPFIYMDKTFPADFDWKRVEVWHEYSDLYDSAIYYNYGDYVVDFATGNFYKCINMHDARDYSLTSTEAWLPVEPMTDDFRLDSASPRQSMGLLDKPLETRVLDMINTISEMDINEGLKSSLTAKLENAVDKIDGSSKRIALSMFKSFINEVNAQSGKGFTSEQADEFETFAQQAIKELEANSVRKTIVIRN